MGDIVAIANQKGGVGKTTTAVNLSACVSQKGYDVLLLDMDPQGNSTSGLGIDKNRKILTMYDVMAGNAEISEVALPTMLGRLSIAPAGVDLVGAEVELVSVMAREHILKNAIEKIKNNYDFIFIDCPPSLGLLTLNSLTAADTLLVPIQCEFFALEGLSQLMNTVSAVKKHLNTSLDVEGVVLTMYDSRTNLSNQVVAEVKKHFSEKVYKTLIPRNVRLSESPSYGLPVMLYDPSCSGTDAYMSLADEFIELRGRR